MINQVVQAAFLLAATFYLLHPNELQAQSAAPDFTFKVFAGPPGPGGEDGVGSEARFKQPFAVAQDAAGNSYIADTYNHVIRKLAPDGTVSTVAGLAAEPGSADGTGGAARFNFPCDLAAAPDGTLYVADTLNNAIRKISPAGAVTTLAGLAGSAGKVDGIGSRARFSQPFGIAIDSAGNVYVSDTYNHTIRKVTQTGTVTTVAGLAGIPGNANGLRTGSRFRFPYGLVATSAGELFVADTVNHTIRRISATGAVTTFAGLSGASGSTDGPAAAARFNFPERLALNATGNLFVADTYNHTVRKISTDGSVVTLAGSAGQSGEANGNGASARFNLPQGLAIDRSGNLQVADTANHLIRQINPNLDVSTLAGAPAPAGHVDGTGSGARFNFPSGVAPDSSGNVFVSDNANHVIRKIAPDGLTTTFAGSAGNPGSSDGSGDTARFDFPGALAVDTAGFVYVTDTYNHTIRKITPAGSVSTLAGAAGVSGTNDGPVATARFRNPLGLTVDAGGNIFVSDTWNHSIRKITPAGEVSTVAGSPGSSGASDGVGSQARFAFPEGIAIDSHGNLFVADNGNSSIRKITPDGTVSTFAGKSGNPGAADGGGVDARFISPFGLAIESSDNVLVADSSGQTIRRITPDGVVSTLAGRARVPGSAAGTAGSARFEIPEGVAVDGIGNVYVADSQNHTIKKGFPGAPDLPTLQPIFGQAGEARQLGIANLTTVSWRWTFTRFPASSSTVLSSVTSQNPVLTPDRTDLYVVRLTARDAVGKEAIRTISVPVDAIAPSVSIASPLPNQRGSNAVITVSGTASDNLEVGQVWCRLNGGGWALASGTTVWICPLNLTPGTNVLSVYAADSSGNLSATQQVTFVYVAVAPLMIQIVGSGSIAPNLNGQSLEIGKTFTVRATPKPGFGFTRWTDGTGTTLGTNPSLAFLMQSNLILRAQFADLLRPSCMIVAPTMGQRLTNAFVLIRGTAKDNAGIDRVIYSLNGRPAQVANGTTNWNVTVLANPGTNVVGVQSIDTFGLASPWVTNRFVYVVTSPLTLETNGIGSITRTFVGLNLEVGRVYKVTAMPGVGQVFSNWVGDAVSSNAILTFVMQSNMVLRANIVPNPFIPTKGNYSGLFYESTGVRQESSGAFALILSDRGTFTGSLQIGTTRFAFAGKFDLSGRALVGRTATLPFDLVLQLDLSPGGDRLTGTVSRGTWTSDVTANRAVFTATSNPGSPYLGKYTMIFPGGSADDSPQGDGYATLSVDRAGNLLLAGMLGDDSLLAGKTVVSKNGLWPLYVPLYGGQGSLIGWISFADRAGDDLNGQVVWTKPLQAAARLYPAGFTVQTEAIGSRYAFTNAIRLLNFGPGEISFSLTTPAVAVTNQIILQANNTVSNLSSNRLTLVITTISGLLKGTATDPGNGAPYPFAGVILQKSETGSGYFPAQGHSGRMLMKSD